MVIGDRLTGIVGYNVQTAVDTIEAIADTGYYRAAPTCSPAATSGSNVLVPGPIPPTPKPKGRFGKEVFAYLPGTDAYRCPAGKTLTRRFETKEGDLTMFVYWCTACPAFRVRRGSMRAWSRR